MRRIEENFRLINTTGVQYDKVCCPILYLLAAYNIKHFYILNMVNEYVLKDILSAQVYGSGRFLQKIFSYVFVDFCHHHELV